MRKFIFSLMAVFAISFASCGGNTAANESSTDSLNADTTVVDSVSVDSTATDSVASE